MAVTRPPPPPPSHASFILAQIRSGLAHLHATSDLDDKSYKQIEGILSRGAEVDTTPPAKGRHHDKEDTEEEKLDKNNAWLRKAMLETDLLPNIVQLAMNIAVPSALLGGSQRDAILKLVSMSQERIANAVTDPALQKRTKSGALTGVKGAHAGLKKGWNVAGQGVNDLSRRREEARTKAETKKAEKQDQKIIKQELKREREEIVRKRQAEMLSGSGDVKDGSRVETGRHIDNDREAEEIIASPMETTAAASMGAPSLSSGTSLMYSDRTPTATDMDGEAMVSVSCSQLTSQGSVAATTTFSPWPGLLLSSTIVATNDEEDNILEEDEGAALSAENIKTLDSSDPLPPPPRRTAPSSIGHGKTSSSTEGERETYATPAQDFHPLPLQTMEGRAPQSALQSSNQQFTPLQPIPSSHPSTSLPQSRDAIQRPQSTSQHPAQGKVVDVTDAKQKSWSKKLGL